MHRFPLMLLIPLVAAAAPTPQSDPAEIDATSLLAGAREVDTAGRPLPGSVGAFDGIVDRNNQWEPPKRGPTQSAVIQLAEPFDLHRMVVVNSLNEKGYPGISTKKLRLEHGPGPEGPWKPVTEVELQKGSRPQAFPFEPVKGVRYLRVTLVENYGNAQYWSLAELSVFGHRSKPRDDVSFTGTWKTDYGPMKLEQKGGLVTGCYGDGSALVEGTADGPVFFGTYQEGDRDGAMALTLTAEGDLSGVWGPDITGKNRSQRWDGTRADKLDIVCASKKESLEDELKQSGRVVLRGILFDTGKDVIKPESLPVLESLAKAIKDTKATYVIEGHTDDRGGAAYNKTLSEKRAASVKKWLVEHGADAARLKTVGYGQTRPAMSNDSEAGRAANRRVEVSVQK
ncbi:MAG: OmpA family protein [Myxococcaceae bacterium]|nr:OmpA family protein [Myxococcaceae bacterium]